MAAQLRASYKSPAPSQLQLLLSQQQPSHFARLSHYNGLLLASRQQTIDRYQQTLDQLAELEPRIAAQTARLEQSQARHKQQHQQLAERKRERDQTLKRLNATIEAKDQQLARTQADRQQLEALLAEVVRALSNTALGLSGDAFGSRKGKLRWPTQGKAANRFGGRRAGNSLLWTGVTLRAPEGREVLAIHQGRVVFSEYLRGQGMLMIIDHGDNYLSLYAHNQTLYKEVGDWVADGELIARVGNSGGEQQAGLYFEIRHQGKPVDPALWCRG